MLRLTNFCLNRNLHASRCTYVAWPTASLTAPTAPNHYHPHTHTHTLSLSHFLSLSLWFSLSVLPPASCLPLSPSPAAASTTTTALFSACCCLPCASSLPQPQPLPLTGSAGPQAHHLQADRHDRRHHQLHGNHTCRIHGCGRVRWVGVGHTDVHRQSQCMVCS